MVTAVELRDLLDSLINEGRIKPDADIVIFDGEYDVFRYLRGIELPVENDADVIELLW